jgi:iron complex transport system ATP-binding protein
MTPRCEAKALAIEERLEPCDLTFEAASLTMLVGPNGAGKTSLLHGLAGIAGTSGEVQIDGRNINQLSAAQRIGLLSYLGASRDIRWPLLSRDFVALGLRPGADQSPVEEALDRMDAMQFADRRLDQLSTGERSRVMIARALAPGPRLVMLDEPCANLDPQWQLLLLERLQQEAAAGAAVIVSIHDLELARQFAERVIVTAVALHADLIQQVFGIRQEGRQWVRA